MNTLLARKPVAQHSAAVRPLRPASFLGLGLDAQYGSDGRVSRLSGLRGGRIVEIRLFADVAHPDERDARSGTDFPAAGPSDVADDTWQGGSATWILSACPRFDVVLGSWSAIPRVLADAIGDVPIAAPIWQGLRIFGGEVGLLAVRAAGSTMPQAFQHDLWLLERITGKLGLLPLPAGDLAAHPIPSGPSGVSVPRHARAC